MNLFFTTTGVSVTPPLTTLFESALLSNTNSSTFCYTGGGVQEIAAVINPARLRDSSVGYFESGRSTGGFFFVVCVLLVHLFPMLVYNSSLSISVEDLINPIKLLSTCIHTYY